MPGTDYDDVSRPRETNYSRDVYDDWDEDARSYRPELHPRSLDFGLLLLRLGTLLLLPWGLLHASDMPRFIRLVGNNLVGGQAPEFFAWMVMLGMIALPILIAAGLFTRPAAFLATAMMASIFMLVIFASPSYEPLDGQGVLTGENALLYIVLFLPLVFTGAGRWSLDGMRSSGF
ncbi:DoxX family protein [Ornithinimicrobium sp. Y1847]|uniref:DoxX family protein n=1 Tax=unclassified Ornithinimicrobium TaxID=2615080 RepID=UPI003B67D429